MPGIIIDNEYIVHGPAPLERLPNATFGKVLYRSLCDKNSLPIALIDAISRKTVSYKTILEESSRLAHCLDKYGIKKNDVVAISSENSLAYFYPVLATQYLGAIVTMFNHQYTPREILHAANISKPTIIFCCKVSQKSILEAQKQLEFIKKIIVIDAENDVGHVQSMNSFILEHSLDYKILFRPVEAGTEEVAFILYSSGTTSLAKGVMLTHKNLNASIASFRDHRFYRQVKPGTTFSLGLIPFFHTYGLNVLISGFIFGITVVIMPKFDGNVFLQSIKDFNIMSLSIVPPLAVFLADSSLVDNYDFSHVRKISNGAAALHIETEKTLLRRFKNVKKITKSYGLTEATSAMLVLPHSDVKLGSCGKVVAGNSAKVVDVATGKSLGPGQFGELYFKGPLVMKGYVNDIEGTNVVLDKHGWLQTGDLGYYDDERYFFIVDRLKEMIKYKGFQVAPTEIESVLKGHPKIIDAAVVGLPDQRSGELPLAFVVKRSGQQITQDEVKCFIQGSFTFNSVLLSTQDILETLSPQKWLRGGVRFVEEIPKSATGKILRKLLLSDLPIERSKL